LIFVEVVGGLGNQMFQYAFYEKLRKCYGNDKVKLHIGYFKEIRDNKGYELNKVFSIQGGGNFHDVITNLLDDKMDFFSRVRRKIFGFKSSYYIEGKDLSYKENIFSLDKNRDIYLRGLWQSEKYFSDIKDEILEIFKFPIITDLKNKKILNSITNSNSVSIHVRRGDYISNSTYNEILGNACDSDYYIKAINKIYELIDNPIFYIFSDDINWVKENLGIVKKLKVQYIDWNNGQNSFIDMQLMSLCKNNIIANSTFSWWGAWLNKNENKVVIAPKRWFLAKKINNDIIPDNWIKI